MPISFFKYQGAGNDFVIVDNRAQTFPKENTALVESMCQRRFGVGADGLILLEADDKTDFHMVYYNADGKESTMCGNGGRCIVAFAKKLGLIERQTTFRAIDGIHHAEVLADGRVALGMNDVLEIQKTPEGHYILDTGSPHYVIVKENMPGEIVDEAKKIRYNEQFKEQGINVNFITVSGDKVTIRTYERGVEDETLACGTGSVAAAIVAGHLVGEDRFKVAAQGGDLEVLFQSGETYTKVQLLGPAEFVFQGLWG